MSATSLIDINSLLEPISAENAVGIDLRKDTSIKSIYTQIRDARKSARAAERSAVFSANDDKTQKEATKKAVAQADEHWRKVIELAPTILKSHAKDLEVACWYTEALARKPGVKGLRSGFTLIRQLIERYWDGLFPLPDEEGMETRTAPLAGLNGEDATGVLLVPIRSITITDKYPPGPFSYWQYQQIVGSQKSSDESGVVRDGIAMAEFQKTVEQSSQEFYLELRDDVRGCLDEYRQISQLLDERCGSNNSPPTSSIINLLDEILSTINHIAKDKLPLPEPDEQNNVENTAGGSATPGAAGGPIKSREEAFRQLHYISQFFRKTEPHSPISYVIEKAVKWGNMSLGELIADLIPDPNSRQMYSTLTGVNTKQEPVP
jgi:type VI secretion system protein ImpA